MRGHGIKIVQSGVTGLTAALLLAGCSENAQPAVADDSGNPLYSYACGIVPK